MSAVKTETNWETVVGLEVHAELKTKTKIFCACETAFGGEPNTRVCPVCAGLPGALPRLNRAVLEAALRLGLTLGCQINRRCAFDRKAYFYPDLPKAYQISQLYAPVCAGGSLEIETDAGKKSVGLTQIHMEEDAGKLIHGAGAGETYMDFNRCGVPLLEIVSKPDMRSAAEAAACMEKLREILLFLDVSDCKMQEGSLRADVNVSVRRPGGPLGVRVEMKNLNSFKAVKNAIEFEKNRQIDIFETGGRVEQETRRWDDERGESFAMRSKENAQDYRYFPEPDLLPVRVSESFLARVKEALPELAHQKRERYARDFGLSAFEASVLTAHKNIAALFEKTAELSGEPQEAARLITGEVMRLCADAGVSPGEAALNAKALARLITLLTGGRISRAAFKQAAEAVFKTDCDPEAFIAENGLFMNIDADAAREAAKAVIARNARAAAEYRAGKEKAFGFLMGALMRELGGGASPDAAKAALEELL